MKDNFFGITDVGKVRGNNEDAFIAQKTGNNKFIIACVIDGVGGYSGGEVAAEIARKSIIDHLKSPSGDIIALMVESFHIANEKIWEERQRVKEYDSMACVLTLAIIDIENNEFYYTHVGDTRLYLLRDQSLVKISNDHSFVGFLEDSGRLTEQAAMSHPKRNEINKALGFASLAGKDDDYIERGRSPFLPGDTLLLCSDGLTDMVDKNKITSIITDECSLEDKGIRLIKSANTNGGNDNITVVLVQNNKTPMQHNATMPAANLNRKTDQTEIKDINHQEIRSHDTIKNDHSGKSHRGLIGLLSVLCLLFLASSLYLLLQNKQKGKSTEKTITLIPKTVVNPDEVKLQNAINNIKGKTLILSDSVFKKPIVINEAVLINNDTLYIKARGKIILKRDSAYAGTGLVISAKSKYIVLDSLNFEDFNNAVSTYNAVLYLKNTRFSNCTLPVQTFFTFPGNNYVTGRIPVTAFKADTLPKIIK